MKSSRNGHDPDPEGRVSARCEAVFREHAQTIRIGASP